uniref:Ribosome biogenesis protein BRX1 homolog n=1 Tax=Syphacia muris TaxID=451379 RepID=A0A0N5AD32_9BILA
MGKLKRLLKANESSASNDSDVPMDSDSSTDSDVPMDTEELQLEWKNRERVLIFCSRGVPYRIRHLMNDLKSLMPHSKSENKMDKNSSLKVINEIAEIANCSKCIYLECRKRMDVYCWISDVVHGPSVKFLVHNIHTMDELRMSGNCLKASRPVLSFDSAFDEKPHYALIKELIKQTFATPNNHPKSQPFIDHVFSFSLTSDGKIWFRNFQIVDENLELQEIGPRLVLEIIRIFEGSFEGTVLYDNPNYVSPNTVRQKLKKTNAEKYINRKLTEKAREEKQAKFDAVPRPDPVGEIFNTDKEIEAPAAKKLKSIIEKKWKPRKKKRVKSASPSLPLLS